MSLSCSLWEYDDPSNPLEQKTPETYLSLIATDTIYAYQDLNDDINNNIKSTAVLFGYKGYKYVQIFYNIFFIIIGFLGFYSSQTFISLIVIIVLIIAMNLYLKKWKLDSRESCNYYFKFNNVIGLSCFLFLVLF